MTRNLLRTTVVICIAAFATPDGANSGDAPKKGMKTFDIHYVYHPVAYSEVPGVGKITVMESAGEFETYKGESVKFAGALKNKCQMVSIESGGKAWTEGACVSTDADGDHFFATFDSRNLDASQPKLNCGSYVVTGGTGKFKGMSATGAYACAMAEAPKGEPAGSFAMDVAHIENWQMN